jgi:hypothetical protein
MALAAAAVVRNRRREIKGARRMVGFPMMRIPPSWFVQQNRMMGANFDRTLTKLRHRETHLGSAVTPPLRERALTYVDASGAHSSSPVCGPCCSRNAVLSAA